MGSLGVLFALSPRQLRRLESAGDDDDEVMAAIEGIEEDWAEEHLLELDKSWDALHRALTDGGLAYDNGIFPLSHAILGGASIYGGEDYIVSFKSADEVDAIATGLAALDDEAIGERYDTLVPADYDPIYGPEDRASTISAFRDLVRFYADAAEASRPVIFTVDQ
jgi:hypothetical protein